jgi:hypothetical protein
MIRRLKDTLLIFAAIAAGWLAGSPRSSIGQAPPVNTNLVVQNLVATAVSSNQINLTWQTDSLNGEIPSGWVIYRNGEWIATITNRFEAPMNVTIQP